MNTTVVDEERKRLRCWLGGEFDSASEISADLQRADALADQGERELLKGDVEKALALLDKAIAQGASTTWPYVYRSAARLRGGDADGAWTDAEASGRLAPALKGMIRLHQGKTEEALKLIDEAVAADPKGWALALRASLRARTGDLTGAREDIDRALATEDQPWLRLERAVLLNKTGDYEGALKDLEKVKAALPDAVEPHQCAASIYLDQARYAHAVEALGEVLKRRPDDHVSMRKRARVFVVQNKFEDAARDLEGACGLAPDDLYLRQELIQLDIMSGRGAQAERLIKGRKLTRGAAEFWLAYLRFREKKYAEAEKLFAKSASLQRPHDVLLERARYYGCAAAMLESAEPVPPAKEKELVIVGLGYRHPFQVSLGSLRELTGADAFFSNLSDPKVSDFLGLFPSPLQTIVFRGTERQAEDAAKDTMAGFSKFRRVVMVTRGLPICYGRLAWKLVEACRREGIAVRTPGAVSIQEFLPTLAGTAAGGRLGLQVRGGMYLAGTDPTLPLVVYSPKMVEGDVSKPYPPPKGYPPGHVCYLMPGGGEDEYSAVPVAYRDLEKALDRANPAAVLYVPPIER